MNHEKPKPTCKAVALRALTLAVSSTALTGCSQSLDTSVCKDGTYEGQSQPVPGRQHVLTKSAAKGQKVTTVKFTVIDEHRRLRNREYDKATTGHTDGKFYQRTQRAVGAEPQCAQKFVETSDTDKVEMITRASISHGSFQSAAEDALDEYG